MRKWLLIATFAVSLLQAADDYPHNKLKNQSFEDGLGSWNVPAWSRSTIAPAIDTAQSVHGKQSVLLSGQANDSFLYIQTLSNQQAQAVRCRASAWIKREGVSGWSPQMQLEAGFRQENKDTYKYYTLKPTGQNKNGFQEYSGVFDVPAGARTLRMVLSGKAGAKSGNWKIWFDHMELSILPELSDSMKLTECIANVPHGLFTPADKINLSFSATNCSANAVQGEMKIIITDFFGKEVDVFSQKISIEPESTRKIDCDLQKLKLKNGFYALNVTIESNLGVFKTTGSFAIVTPREKRDPFFGFCGWSLGGSAKSIAMLNAGSAGCPVFPFYEKSPGKTDWSYVDTLMRGILDNNMTPVMNIIIPGYSKAHNPQWKTRELDAKLKAGKNPHDDEYYQIAENFTEELINRYKDRVNDWSVTLEIDLSRHNNAYELDHYRKRLKLLYKQLKRLDPQSSLGAIGVSGCDMQTNPPLKDLRMLMEELHDSLDLIAFDPYITPNTFGPGYKPVGPERGNMLGLMRQTAEISAKYGKKEFAIDEMGYNIIRPGGVLLPPDSQYEKELAAVIARSYIIAKSVPEIKYWLYFNISPALQGNMDWGIFRDKQQPRPAASAYATTADRLAFAGNAQKFELHDDIWIIAFERDHSQVIALWTPLENQLPLTMNLPVDGQCYDLMNNPTPFAKGKQTFTISQYPLFLELNCDRAAAGQMIRNAAYSLPAVNAKADFIASNLLRISAMNLLNTPLPAGITVGDETKLAMLKPRGTTALDFPVPASESYQIPYTIQIGEKIYQFNAAGKFISAARLTGAFRKDADLAEFSPSSIELLNTITSLSPVDAAPNGLWSGPEDLSAKVYTGYDNEALYLAVDVTDDFIVQTQKGAWIWRNDSIQFAFAAAESPLPENGYGKDIWEFAMAQTPAGPELYCYSAPEHTGLSQSSITRGADFSVHTTQNRIIYKLKLPWSFLKMTYRPDLALRFNLVVFDSDAQNKSANYWMQLTGGITGGKDINKFRTLILK